MPHSSGGGSHGGGSHGGGSRGGGPRVSTHYFRGSRRYRRRNNKTGDEDYIYASSDPGKSSFVPFIVMVVYVSVFFILSLFVSISGIPGKLKTNRQDKPEIYDDINVFDNCDELTEKLEDYYELSGICTVIYTVYSDEWDSFESLEDYSYFKYTSNFSDENHFVIVYSIPREDAALLSMGEVPDYAWEATQGDNTDPFIRTRYFKRFADRVQSDMERADNPGEAFEDAFDVLIKYAKLSLEDGDFRKIATLKAFEPLMYATVAAVPIFTLFFVKLYRRKEYAFEEVPLQQNDQMQNPPS